MSYFRFYFCVRNISWVAAFLLFSICAHSAEWRECEKAKLRELKLHEASTAQKTSKSKKRQQTSSERREEIETWLWKNCREYSYELRQLEQDRM